MATRLQAYRARAAECSAIAANSSDIKTRMTFAELARQWRLLAERMETMGSEQTARPQVAVDRLGSPY